jgi:DNA-binding transcriptional MerR regulator
MPRLLGIGEFAQATHLSVKTLRNYHDLELLVPAQVDAQSGYRRYTVDQIPVGHVIRRFRDLDMPLEQIGAVVNAPDLSTRNRLVTDHLARLEQHLARTHAAVTSLRNLLEGPPPTASIQLRNEAAMLTAAISDTVALVDLASWFQGALGELHATIGAQNLAAAGPGGSVVSDSFFADDRGEVTVFVPTTTDIRRVGRLRPLTLPEVELATITHVGSHEEIDRSYGMLVSYVANAALAVGGPIRERYLVGRPETSDPSGWRTEIGLPVFRIGGA